jgi:hypothetical protein
MEQVAERKRHRRQLTDGNVEITGSDHRKREPAEEASISSQLWSIF